MASRMGTRETPSSAESFSSTSLPPARGGKGVVHPRPVLPGAAGAANGMFVDALNQYTALYCLRRRHSGPKGARKTANMHIMLARR